MEERPIIRGGRQGGGWVNPMSDEHWTDPLGITPKEECVEPSGEVILDRPVVPQVSAAQAQGISVYPGTLIMMVKKTLMVLDEGEYDLFAMLLIGKNPPLFFPCVLRIYNSNGRYFMDITGYQDQKGIQLDAVSSQGRVVISKNKEMALYRDIRSLPEPRPAKVEVSLAEMKNESAQQILYDARIAVGIESAVPLSSMRTGYDVSLDNALRTCLAKWPSLKDGDRIYVGGICARLDTLMNDLANSYFQDTREPMLESVSSLVGIYGSVVVPYLNYMGLSGYVAKAEIEVRENRNRYETGSYKSRESLMPELPEREYGSRYTPRDQMDQILARKNGLI